MKLYQVTARYTEDIGNGCRRSGGVMTFYLRNDIQGIVDADHAERIARRMLSDLKPHTDWHIGIGESIEFDPSTIGA